MPKQKSSRIIRKCKICDNTFECLPSCKKQYCCKKCANTDIETKEKIRNSLRDKWNSSGHPMSHAETREKHKNTMILTYGVSHALQNKGLLNKSEQTKISKYGSAKYNNTNKIRKTKLEKYGSENYNGNRKRTIKKYNDILVSWKHVIPRFNISEFKGVNDIKYAFQCVVCNNEFECSIDNGIIPICRNCSPSPITTQSYGEKEISQYIQELVPNIQLIEKDRKILHGQELDIVIPEYKFAIEYNGIYWHSESKISDKKYHLKKTKKCIQAGYSLLHIFDYQWHQKQDIIKSMISSRLGLNKKIAARNCSVRSIKSSVKTQFLERTHLQGSCNSKINIGLFYENKLVAVATFGKPRYINNVFEYELIRFASELNTTIVGGFSKLIAYFIKIYNPKNILTYCDRTISSGNTYIKNKFKLLGVTGPNYFYFKGANVYSRELFQKHKLQNKLSNFNTTLTEYENMQLNGYDRCWDCGNYKFVFMP